VALGGFSAEATVLRSRAVERYIAAWHAREIWVRSARLTYREKEAAYCLGCVSASVTERATLLRRSYGLKLLAGRRMLASFGAE